MRIRGSKAGFTLVELLVVIAIIGVLVALLLPAVQAAREAGRRTTCKNNLKQFGVAFHTHHDALGFLPHGGLGWTYPPTYDANGNPTNGLAQFAGWGFQVLPYMEQDAVFSGTNQGNNVGNKQIQAIGAVIPNFFCPTRRRPQALPATGSWYGPGGNYPHASTDYAGSNGDNNGAVGYG